MSMVPPTPARGAPKINPEMLNIAQYLQGQGVYKGLSPSVAEGITEVASC